VLSLTSFEQESVKAAIYVVFKVANFAPFCNCKRFNLFNVYCHLSAISIANLAILWFLGFVGNRTIVSK